MPATQTATGGAILEWAGTTAPSSTGDYLPIGLLKGDYNLNRSATVHEVMTHNAVAAGSKDKLKKGGLRETTVKFSVYGDNTDTVHAALFADVGLNAYFRFKDTSSPQKTAPFEAVIKTVSEVYPLDGYLAFDVDLDLSGGMVLG